MRLFLAAAIIASIVVPYQAVAGSAVRISGPNSITHGYSRLMADENIVGCAYDRYRGNIVHLDRSGNGVRVDGFAVGFPKLNEREYVNVEYGRLSMADMGILNELLINGKKIDIVVYRCGAAGRMLYLDEITFMSK